MISPCILVCRIDPASGHCTGCGRTLAEIASWTAYGDDVRQRLMDLLPARLAAISASPSGDMPGQDFDHQRGTPCTAT